MKRILSIILTLVLLVTSLVIPMSISAATLDSETHISAIKAAVAGLDMKDEASKQILVPVGIYSRNATSRNFACANIADGNDGRLGTVAIQAPNGYGGIGGSANLWGIPYNTSDTLISYGYTGAFGTDVQTNADTLYGITKGDINELFFYIKSNIDVNVRYALSTSGGNRNSTAATGVTHSSDYTKVVVDFAKMSTSADTDQLFTGMMGIEDGNTATVGFAEDAEVIVGSMLMDYDTDEVKAVNAYTGTDLTELIGLAEKIDYSLYTDATATALKNAVTAAKTAIVETDDVALIAKLVNAEYANLTVTEQLLRANIGYKLTDAGIAATSGTVAIVSGATTGQAAGADSRSATALIKEITPDWRYFSEKQNLFIFTSNGTTSTGATGAGAYTFNVADYTDIYIDIINNSGHNRSIMFSNVVAQFGALNNNGGFINGTKTLATTTEDDIMMNRGIVSRKHLKNSLVTAGITAFSSMQLKLNAASGLKSHQETAISPVYGVKTYGGSVANASTTVEIYNNIKAVEGNWSNLSKVQETANIIKANFPEGAVEPDAAKVAMINAYEAATLSNSGLEIDETNLAASILNRGNDNAVADVMKKAMNGEDINIVAFGGSITQGGNYNAAASQISGHGFTEKANYANLVGDWFKDVFNSYGSEVNMYNAGIAATDTPLAIHRMNMDVMSFNPDLVIVEWDKNDTKGDAYKQSTYENMVRQFLSKGVAVVMLGMAGKCADGVDDSSIATHEPIAEHYSLPYISYRDAFGLDSGILPKLTEDGTHPNIVGHHMAALILNHYFGLVYKNIASAGEYTFDYPATPYNDDATLYGEGSVVTLDAIVDGKVPGVTMKQLGSFVKDTATLKTAGGQDISRNHKYYGYKAAYAAEYQPMVLEFDNLYSLNLLLMRSNGMTDGTFKVMVNGEEKTHESFTSGTSGDNTQIESAYMWASANVCINETPAKTTVEILPTNQNSAEGSYVGLYGLLIGEKPGEIEPVRPEDVINAVKDLRLKESVNALEVMQPYGSVQRESSAFTYTPISGIENPNAVLGTKGIKVPTGYTTLSHSNWPFTGTEDFYAFYTHSGKTSLDQTALKDSGGAAYTVSGNNELYFYVKTNTPITIKATIQTGNGFLKTEDIRISPTGDSFKKVSIDVNRLAEQITGGCYDKICNFVYSIDKRDGGEILATDEIIIGSAFISKKLEAETNVLALTSADLAEVYAVAENIDTAKYSNPEAFNDVMAKAKAYLEKLGIKAPVSPSKLQAAVSNLETAEKEMIFPVGYYAHYVPNGATAVDLYTVGDSPLEADGIWGSHYLELTKAKLDGYDATKKAAVGTDSTKTNKFWTNDDRQYFMTYGSSVIDSYINNYQSNELGMEKETVESINFYIQTNQEIKITPHIRNGSFTGYTNITVPAGEPQLITLPRSAFPTTAINSGQDNMFNLAIYVTNPAENISIKVGSLFRSEVEATAMSFKADYGASAELSIDMIKAAEAIKNDNGNYTAESYSALQDAIATAKTDLGLTEVTAELNDDTKIVPQGDYELEYAVEGKSLPFKIDMLNNGSVSSVTYGGEVITPVDGVYTITVDNAKELIIMTSRDGYATVDGNLIVDGNVKRDILMRSTGYNHATWSQNQDTVKNGTETVVYQESVMFYTGRTTVKLMYPVENIIAVTSYNVDANGEFTKYYNGTDFTVNADGEIVLTSSTTIPVYGTDEGEAVSDFKTSDSSQAGTWENKKQAAHQVLITYTYKTKWDNVDYDAPAYVNNMTSVYDKLNASSGEVNVLFMGDSITTGCDASGQEGLFYSYNQGNEPTGPIPVYGWQKYLGISGNERPAWTNDAWDVQVVNNLKAAYPNVTINRTNRAVGSSAPTWYMNHIEKLMTDVDVSKQDIVFIAFGMNEKQISKDAHKANVEQIINYIRGKNPNASIVLVSAFYPNIWNNTTQTWNPYELASHEVGYFELAEEYENIAVAPVYSAFAKIRTVKEGVDYTANAFNHPNDYGVNLYADTITTTVVNSVNVSAPKSMEILSTGLYNEGGTDYTAVYLFAEYKSPCVNGVLDPTKIILTDGTVGNVVSRSIYVATQSTATTLGDAFGRFEGQSKVISSTVTGDALKKYWRKTNVNATAGTATTVFGYNVQKITKDTKDTAFAVRGKIVYEVDGKEYTVYTNINAPSNFSAQGAYNLMTNKPTWFE